MLVYRGVTTPEHKVWQVKKSTKSCVVSESMTSWCKPVVLSKEYSSMFMCRSSDIYIYIHMQILIIFLPIFIGLIPRSKGSLCHRQCVTPKDNCHIVSGL